MRTDAEQNIHENSKRILGIALLASLALHILSFVNLDWLQLRYGEALQKKRTAAPVAVRIVNKPTPEADRNKIVDVPLLKTERPDDAKYSSHQDHKTERETKVESKLSQRGKNAGEKGSANDAQVSSATPPKTFPSLSLSSGTLAIGEQPKNQERKNYKKLLPNQKDLSGLANAGYIEHLKDDIELGDRIDLNTTEYRYMGYMTGLRKAIELVWTYPSEAAQRGMQGEVVLEFVIAKSGEVSRIKVIRSSGYKILDDNIVKTLKLSSPFSPLPDSFGKEKMMITGAFTYVLSPYVAGAH